MVSLLHADQLSVQRHASFALKNIDCEVNPGCILGVCGPNAAGKSTLLRALAGLELLTTGGITLRGQSLAKNSPQARARAIGYLAQDTALGWSLTTRELVMLGRYPHRAPWSNWSAHDQAAFDSAVHDADIHALLARPVETLSGGERMRAHLARVFAGQPRIILADEPITALEPRYQFEVLATLRRLAQTEVGIVVVLHDLALASRYCDQLLILAHGAVVARGTPHDALTPEILRDIFGVRGIWDEHRQLLAVQPVAL